MLGIVSAAPTGAPPAPTTWVRTPRWPVALEYHAIRVVPEASLASCGSFPYWPIGA